MKYISSKETINVLINDIINKKPNMYLRFGDGDFYLMRGESDMLASSSSEMINSFRKTFSLLNSNNYLSVNFHCKELNTLEEGMYPGVHECPYDMVCNFVNILKNLVPNIDTIYSPVPFHQSLSFYPELYIDFLKEIKKNNSTIILGTKEFKNEGIDFYFGENIFIGGNSSNSFFERERIAMEFDQAIQKLDKFTVCILALGCGGRAMCHYFIESINKHKKDILIIDIGSSIDILMNRNTRAWIEYTNPNINEFRKKLLE
jgi:hypothetical protein